MKKKNIKFVLITMILIIAAYVGWQAYSLFLQKDISDQHKKADMFFNKDEFKKASTIYTDLLKEKYKFTSGEKQAELVYRLAICSKKTGNLKKAETLLNRITNQFKNSEYIDEALLELGELAQTKDDLKKAEALYDRILNEYSSSNIFYNTLYAKARIYKLQGKLLNALSLLDMVTLKSDSDELKNTARKEIEDINVKLIFSPIPTKDSVIYKVEAGDSLGSIAKQFNTTVDLIIKSNKLKDTVIRPEKRLKITSGAGLSIEVNTKFNKLILKNNGKFVKIYTVATGAHNGTPLGNFKIVNKLKNPTWYTAGAVVSADSPKNVLGSRWMGITEKGYGIHGTTDPESIGKQSTEGCVRMYNKDVEELFDLVPVGTPITIRKAKFEARNPKQYHNDQNIND
ncbi:L,D-transpeptidase family protein [bacterium]|nr:L,D-transpeptidase family protein [bacterium]